MTDITLKDIKTAYRVIDAIIAEASRDDDIREWNLSHEELLSMRFVRDALANKITRSIIISEMEDAIWSKGVPYRGK